MTSPADKKMFDFLFLNHRARKESLALPDLLLQAQKAVTTVLNGAHPQHKPGSGEQFWQFRDYSPQDRPQDIDWRQSAKGDRIFTREKEKQSSQTALFWCAGGPGMAYRSLPDLPSKRESALILNMAAAMMAAHAGERVGLLEGHIAPGRSDSSLQVMAQVMMDQSVAIPSASTMPPRHATLILAGDFLDTAEQLSETLAPLASRTENGLLLQVLDPAELTLPFTGRAIFQNISTRQHIAHIESVREAYRARIEAHLAFIEHMCRRFQWQRILHVTDRPLHETLRTLWQTLSAKRGAS